MDAIRNTWVRFTGLFERFFKFIKEHWIPYTLLVTGIPLSIIISSFLEEKDRFILAMYIVALIFCCGVAMYCKRGCFARKDCNIPCSLVNSVDEIQEIPLEERFIETIDPVSEQHAEVERQPEAHKASIFESNIEQNLEADPSNIVLAQVHQPDSNSPLRLSPSTSVPSSSSQPSVNQPSTLEYTTARSSIKSLSSDSDQSLGNADILKDSEIPSNN